MAHGRGEAMVRCRVPRRLHRAAATWPPRRSPHSHFAALAAGCRVRVLTQARANYWLGRARGGGWTRNPRPALCRRSGTAGQLLWSTRRRGARRRPGQQLALRINAMRDPGLDQPGSRRPAHWEASDLVHGPPPCWPAGASPRRATKFRAAAGRACRPSLPDRSLAARFAIDARPAADVAVADRPAGWGATASPCRKPAGRHLSSAARGRGRSVDRDLGSDPPGEQL